MLTAEEIRKRYLQFFARHQHEIVSSGPLIPQDDKTLLFTNAGMVQFKKLFLGAEKRAYSRATTCQKCLRVSGKHNDLENVGRTARHHTFFEMLGNFSFGDYFKKEAITWAWQFVTEELELDPDKLWVTIYRDDTEAASLWKEIAHLPEERIVRMGEKDNFWTMGDTGPCGPCSEIYIDQGAEMSCGPDCGIGKCDCDRFLEIWNLVFTQFDQAKDGSRTLLAAPNIDTGMGLERIAAVCQGKRSNFDCDLFQDIIQFAAKTAHVSYSFSAPDTNDIDTALRVIADHSRAAAFLIAEGVLPSNESRGYVLRRLLRRALRFATLLKVHEPYLYKVVDRVVAVMGKSYSELCDHADFIAKVVREEELKFSQTLENGLALLEEEMEKLKKEGQTVISGDFCFLLYDTHGFPLDIVNDVVEKRGFTVDVAGFEQNMAKQRDRARAHLKQGGLLGQEEGLDELFKRYAAKGLSTVFTGYTQSSCETSVTMLFDQSGKECESLGQGCSGYMICSESPCYGESGGQIGDCGFVSGKGVLATISATKKPAPTLLVHTVSVEEGTLALGSAVTISINSEKREGCCRNHSCTHLLHAALRLVLGTHVHQMGSSVDCDRLRFDFSHMCALTPEEIARVEEEVNKNILADMPVETLEMDREQAKKLGAMALFDDKYGERVRVVTMGTSDTVVSRELCGGTHLRSTGQAGVFFIVSESGVASGTRRIEAVTGWGAYKLAVQQRATLMSLQTMLKSGADSLQARVETLLSEIKKLRKAKDTQSVGESADSLLKNVVTVSGISLLCVSCRDVSIKALREQMDALRNHLDSDAVICLASSEEKKATLLLYVSKNLHGRFDAPTLIRDIASVIGGSGGGRKDLAQAGGTMPENIPQAFEKLKELLQH